MNRELRMAELLCTRLCHDLTGPIGAVNNGAEFISEDGFNMQNDAVDLIVSSAFSAVARLQFYRFAYGRVKDSGEASLSEKKCLVEDYFQGSQVTLDWPDEYTDASGISVSSKMVRLLFNLVIIASGGLLKGGTVSIRFQETDAKEKQLSVEARGEVVKWEPDAQAVLENKVDISKITPKEVQMYLTAQLADELGAALAVEASADSLCFVATQAAVEQQTTIGEASHG